jgi:hypothetical protein
MEVNLVFSMACPPFPECWPVLVPQLKHHFLHNVVHRNDLSLLAYGFVQEREWPLLCAVDRFGTPSIDEWPETPLTDDDYSASWHTAAPHAWHFLALWRKCPTAFLVRIFSR